MLFKVSRNDFFKCLQKVINVIPSKSTTDIVYNVLITADNGELKIIATDLEITQIAWTQCEVVDSGSITVPGKLLMDIIREMPEIPLEFEADSKLKIMIKSSFGEYKLSGQSKNEFPSVPIVESEQIIQVNNSTLKRMIEKTIFACSTDNLRPALTGVLCQIFETEYRMISTDGHRLVKFINKNFKNPGFVRELIIPTKALNFVARNLSEDSQQKIVISENHVLFEFSNTKIFSRLIKDPYPDYERVIPNFFTKDMKVNREQFIASLKRVSLFSNPLSYQVIISIDSDKLTIQAQDIDFGGEAKEQIPCQFSSEPLEISYNANYLSEILRHTDSEEVKFMVEDSDSPGLVYALDQPAEEEVVMLLMPVRLND
jgi:DNA polymerase-3 subunit beta